MNQRISPTIEWSAFRDLPDDAFARLVKDMGCQVCVFPINGTRRWFMLEHWDDTSQDFWAQYMDTALRNHIDLYRLIFDHGIQYLLTPIFGPDILERGEEYMAMASPGMAHLVEHPDALNFYDEYEIRVSFYGEYRRYLEPTPYAHLCDIFDSIAERTAHHEGHRLLYGVFGNDATQTIAELSVAYYLEHGEIPDRQTLIELYYGEMIPPVDLFIGFEKLAAFDMPLVATGSEDLYFMVSPSSYLNRTQLRRLLYDHLFARRWDDLDYQNLTEEDWAQLREFYHANQGSTLGVGALHKRLGLWYLLPQVQLTGGFDGDWHT